MHGLSNLSDEDLLRGLHLLATSQRHAMAELVLHLAEVDARRLYAHEGFASLFGYCVEKLRFSEDEACRRIEAARLVRKFPVITELLKEGAVTLTVLGLLKPHLTEGNHPELLAGVSSSSVRNAKEWLAVRFAEPDVPWSIRKLPEGRRLAGGSRGAGLPAPAGVVVAAPVVGPAQEPSSPAATRVVVVAQEPSSPAATRVVVVAQEPSSPAAARVAVVEPLSRDRFLVKLTATRALRDKLELARDLMSHGNPSGDLAVVIERALDVLLCDLEKTKLGETRPARKRRVAARTHVASSTRREVVARDGLGCSFVAPDGHRCGARAFLEFDHETPKGRGGDSEPQNVRLLCRTHNRLAAERVYGEAHMERAVAESRRAGKEGMR